MPRHSLATGPPVVWIQAKRTWTTPFANPKAQEARALRRRRISEPKGGKIMLLGKLRFELIERLSVKTMRYVSAVPRAKANGLVARIYDMIAEDFFINGSLTSHSKVPPLLAGVWTGGRESILVADRLDRTTKEAMMAVLSRVNDCPTVAICWSVWCTAAVSMRRRHKSFPKAKRKLPTPFFESGLNG